MIDAIVWTTLAFTLAFVAGWLWRPDLRAWIERPKYRFQANVRSYDQEGIEGEYAKEVPDEPA